MSGDGTYQRQGDGVYRGSPAYGNKGAGTPITWDPTNDYAVWDDPETITYTSHGTNPPGDQTFTIYPAFRFELRFREMAASGGVYTTKDRLFVLPDVVVRPYELKPADFFFDFHNTRWTVLESQYNVQETVWDLTCRDLVLAHQLHDLITIKACVNTIDPTGSRVATFPTSTYANIPARIQETSSRVADERGKRVTTRTYIVYLGQQVDVGQEDRMYDAAGNIYEIKGSLKVDLITDLPQLECERRGW